MKWRKGRKKYKWEAMKNSMCSPCNESGTVMINIIMK